MLSVNCSHVCFINVKIYEKIWSGGLEVSLSIVPYTYAYTLNRSYKWPLYIFGDCSESNYRSYKM